MLRSSWNDLKCLGGTLFQHLLLCSNMKAGEGRHRQKTFVSHCPGAGVRGGSKTSSEGMLMVVFDADRETV